MFCFSMEATHLSTGDIFYSFVKLFGCTARGFGHGWGDSSDCNAHRL